ncbi:MAG: thioredoxin domain-containing protein [Bdellovibrio sp.]
MPFSRSSLLTLGTLVALLVGIACTKEAESKPNFVYKDAPKSGVVAKINGQEVSEGEMLQGITSEIYEAEMKVYELKMNRLRSMMLEKFMNAHPEKKNLSNDEFLDKVIAKDLKISDAEVEKFIKERGIPKESVTPDLKNRINGFLLMEKKKGAVDIWLGKMTQKNPVEIYIKKPNAPRFEIAIQGAPATGKGGEPVTIVEFSDFQCPFCSKAAETIKEIKKKYGSKVNVVYKNFPLPFHEHAKIAAEAGMCAYEQGNDYFWKMHDAMFADQAGLAKEGLVAKAKAIGLKVDQFTSCLDAGKHRAKVEQDMEDGKNVEVKSTPTFFVNGKIVNGAQPLEVFAELIEEDLK